MAVRFVACYKELAFAHAAGARWMRDARFSACLRALAEDMVVDVRIGVARFVGMAHGQCHSVLLCLVRRTSSFLAGRRSNCEF
jgi:hypothetical protein